MLNILSFQTWYPLLYLRTTDFHLDSIEPASTCCWFSSVFLYLSVLIIISITTLLSSTEPRTFLYLINDSGRDSWPWFFLLFPYIDDDVNNNKTSVPTQSLLRYYYWPLSRYFSARRWEITVLFYLCHFLTSFSSITRKECLSLIFLPHSLLRHIKGFFCLFVLWVFF